MRNQTKVGYHHFPGFTLVELLVVITIIGILIALLLPAVQAAREAARKTQCNNQLKQMALAAVQHEQENGFLPSGGWDYEWFGDPDRGFNRRQPGGWLYNILPYIEEQPLHDMGMGMDPTTTPKRNQLGKIAQTPLPIFNCPSRRSAINYPNTYYSQVNITPVATAARTDYAANAGSSQGFVYFNPGGTDPRVVDAPGYNGWPSSPSSGLFLQWKVFDGVVYIISCLKMAEIADGASNTYIFGEKVMNPDYYLDGYWDPGDNNPIYGGFDWDWERCSLWDANRKIWSGPYQDTPGAGFDDSNFGSAHPNGLNMAFCDGSVQAISYSIDRETHRCLCSRSDGKSIDSKKF